MTSGARTSNCRGSGGEKTRMAERAGAELAEGLKPRGLGGGRYLTCCCWSLTVFRVSSRWESGVKRRLGLMHQMLNFVVLGLRFVKTKIFPTASDLLSARDRLHVKGGDGEKVVVYPSQK